MRYTTTAGETISASRTILDDDGNSLLPAVGFPRAILRVGSDILTTAVAVPTGNDTYQASIVVPVFDGVEGSELSLLWVLTDVNGETYRIEDTVYVEEDNPEDRQREPVVMAGSDVMSVEIPHTLATGDEVGVTLYSGNTAVPDSGISVGSIQPKARSTILNIKIPGSGPNALQPSITSPGNMLIKYKIGSREYEFTTRVWIINPSILGNAQNLLTWIDKAQIKNVLPSLRYAMPDLLNALMNGLSHFNMLGSSLTSFNGIWMTGMVSEAWIICAAWYLLTSQYMAEGAMSFDFNGQAVSLSVDRTQFLDNLIGRLESQMNDQLPKVKALLAKSGITSGNGNVSTEMFRAKVGHVGLTRHALTQLR